MSMASRFAVLALCACALASAQAQDKGAERDVVAETLSAIVRVKAKAVPNARSIATLGAEREGSGALVREGYVATIGYLVIEAESIEVTGADAKSVPATLAGYDHASGFALLKLLAPLAGKPLPVGNASALAERAPVLVASWGGGDNVSLVNVVSRRPFSGSWEYLLDAAIFTYPPVMNWSGASLIGAKGELLGLGSLIVADALGNVAGGGPQAPGNMFVPVDLLNPLIEDFVSRGKASGPARPWLGLNTEELRGRLFVVRVSPDGPADKAGIVAGDILVAIGADGLSSLADFYRRLWSRGAAGIEVSLRVLRGSEVKEVRLRSIDRQEYFRARPNY
jgi:S1-C subfamily serine protease